MNIELIKNQVDAMKASPVKDLLLMYFNAEAKKPEAVFDRCGHASDRDPADVLVTPDEDTNHQPKAHPIGIALTYGSQKLCDEVLTALFAMDKDEAVALLCQPWCTYSLYMNDADTFYTLYLTTSKKTRQDLSRWIAKLNLNSLVTLFTGATTSFGSPVYNPVIEVIAKGEPDSTVNLINALSRLNNDVFLNLFMHHETNILSQYYKRPYSAFVGLFKKTDSEVTANALLNRISKLHCDQLKQLFITRLTAGETDSILHYAHRFSTQTMHKALNLLEKMDARSIETVFLSSTPVQIFNTDTPSDEIPHANDMAITLIKQLTRSAPLKRLLFAFDKGINDCFLHQIITLHYTKALRYYIQFTDLSISALNAKQETALELAQRLGHKDMVCLLQARTFYHLLNQSKTERLRLKAQLDLFPDLIHSRWHNGSTLLHLVVDQGNTEALALLLEHQACPNTINDKQATPFEYAITTKNIPCLTVILNHGGTQVSAKSIQGKWPLSHLLSLGEFSLITKMMELLILNQDNNAESSFIEALHVIPYLPYNTTEIDTYLSNMTPYSSLNDGLFQCSKKAQDGIANCLIYTARFLSKNTSDSLLKAAVFFISTQLNALVSEQPPLKKQAAHRQLNLLLFAMNTKVLRRVVSKLQLSPKQQIQMDLVLCEGLMQDSIARSLSFSKLSNIQQGFFSPQRAFASLAQVHLQKGDLIWIHPNQLANLTNALNNEDLYALCNSRLSPALGAMALTRALNTEPVNAEHVRHFFNRLEHDLNLFNQAPSSYSLNELLVMLNAITTPEIKQIVQNFIRRQDKDAPIRACFFELFLQFHQIPAILDDSLLKDMLMAIALDVNAIEHFEMHNALSSWISKISPPEAIALVKRHLRTAETNLPALNECLVEGLWANAMRAPDLMGSLFKWVITKGLGCENSLLHKVNVLLRDRQPQDWLVVDKILNQSLTPHSEIQIQLAQLRVLSFEPHLNMDDLAQLLNEWEEDKINTIRCACEQARAYGLAQLMQVALNGKKKQIPLMTHFANQPTSNLSKTLDEDIKVLQAHHDFLKSLKALKEGVYVEGMDVKKRLKEFVIILQEVPADLTPYAANLWVNSYFPFLKKDIWGEVSQDFIWAFAMLINHSSFSLQSNLVKNLNTEELTLLLEHCLSGLNNESPSRATSCRTLITSLTQMSSDLSEDNIQLIKTYVGQQDLNHLGNEASIKIAQSILNSNTHQLKELTLDGVWIGRLIVSVPFVATITSDILSHLIEKYRLVSLTLKQDEFNCLTEWIKGKLVFNDRNQASLVRLKEEIMQSPARLEHLLAKRDSLLKFRADDSIRALLMKLDENCSEEQKSNLNTANTALKVLSEYKNQQLSTLRTNASFRVGHYLYSKLTYGLGDLQLANSTLYQWISQWLPHQNFVQSELSRKEQITLYDETGKQVGFINDAQYAMTLVNDLPCLFVEAAGVMPNMVFYDEKRQRIGTLSRTGKIDRDNLFTKNTAARLIAAVPKETLTQSPVALDLLLQDLLREDALDRLYTDPDLMSDPVKRLWVEEQIQQHIASSPKLLQSPTTHTVINHHRQDLVMTLLAQTHHSKNADMLFHAILAHNEKREALFNATGTEFADYLDHFNAPMVLADYLLKHRNNPWFNKGLKLFSVYATNKQQPDLLTQALVILRDESQTLDAFNALMTHFIANEEAARLVLNGFLMDIGSSIQSARTQSIDYLTALFNKSHLISSLTDLNAQQYPVDSWRYRLHLMIYAAHQNILYVSEELRYSKTTAWSVNELKHITDFLKRHLSHGHDIDQDFKIGHDLLSELLFRNANFGQTNLFYTSKGELNPLVTGFTLKRSLLKALASKFFDTDHLKKSIIKGFRRLHCWFDPEQHIKNLLSDRLEKNRAIMDWEKMASESWAHTEQTELPIICAYLLNYSGPAAPLQQLINDYFTSNTLPNKGDHLLNITQCLTILADNDMGACLFSSLVNVIIHNPNLLTERLFSQLVFFHQKKHVNLVIQPNAFDTELALIYHFGQLKEYALVSNCCDLLQMKRREDHYSQKIIRQIKTEAQVEGSLVTYLQRWFFKLIRFVKRAWHYEKTPSSYIRFCDDTTPYNNPEIKPAYIHSKEMGGQVIEGQLKKQKSARSLQMRFQAFKEKEATRRMARTESLKINENGLFQAKTDLVDSEEATLMTNGEHHTAHDHKLRF